MPQADKTFDILLRGGTVIDGTGAPPFSADIGIRGERIAAVGDLADATAGRIIDAAGLYITPGFIDIHTHSDLSVLFTPGMDSSLAQGVTSEVVGNCGFSMGLAQTSDEFAAERRWLEKGGFTIDWNDLATFLRRVDENGIATNIATLAGHGTLRKRVMGAEARRPDAAEMAAMQRELGSALDAGAIGLSSGLEYVPGMYGDVEELTALARVAAEAGAFYATHLRDEGDKLEEAVAEALAVAEGAKISLQLSHHKAERPQNWGKVTRTLAMVDAARERGLDVLLDQYPYTAYQTGLMTVALPSWAAAATPEELGKKLAEPGMRERVLEAMGDVDYSAVQITSCRTHCEYLGKTVQEIAVGEGVDPREWVLSLLMEDAGHVSAVYHALSEADVERVLSDPHVMIGSDAVAASPTGPAALDRPHPRSYGTFARVLAQYVRDRGLLTWEEAVRRMTSLPAQRLRWTDRGRIAEGAIADIAVLDPRAIQDIATFADPHRLAVGVEYVLVAGTLAFAQGIATGSRTGRVLRR